MRPPWTSNVRLKVRTWVLAIRRKQRYLDRSRGRRRRWCQMERCGSRAKVAEYRKRRAAPTEDPGATAAQAQ